MGGADKGAIFCVYISDFTDEKRKENQRLLYTIQGPLTIYTFCSNFAHFAHETSSEKHKKEPLSSENGLSSILAPNRNRTGKKS